MKDVRVVGAVLSVLSALTALTACGSSRPSSDSGSATITYWGANWASSVQQDAQILQPIADEFKKETGITVNIQIIGWPDLQTKIQTAVTSNQGPDVINIGNTWGSSLQATGAFTEFDTANAAAVGGLDKFVKAALDAGGAPGKTPTSVPLSGQAYAVYYNKKMFSDAGIQPPSTWEDLVADAKKLTDPSKDQWGMGVQGASYTSTVHFAFMFAAQNGVDYFDASGKPNFNQSGAVSGIKRYLDLMGANKVVNPSDAQVDDATSLATRFTSNKIGMLFNPGDATIRQRGFTDADYGAVRIPAPTNAVAQVSTFPAGGNVSIFKYSRNQDADLKWVKFLTSPDTQAKLSKAWGSLPVLTSADPSTLTATQKVQIEAYQKYSKPLPQVANESAFESSVGKMTDGLFAKIASGATVTEADISAGLMNAQAQVSAQQ